MTREEFPLSGLVIKMNNYIWGAFGFEEHYFAFFCTGPSHVPRLPKDMNYSANVYNFSECQMAKYFCFEEFPISVLITQAPMHASDIAV